MIAFILTSPHLFGQGFDWQYSSRMPSTYPYAFIGPDFNYSITDNYGDFQFLEDRISCCSFDNGNGNTMKFGISSEYWIQSNIALSFGLAFSVNGNTFTALSFFESIYVPGNDTVDLWVNFIYESNIKYISFSPGIKYKPFDSHINITGLISFAFLAGSEFTFKEKAVSPDWFQIGPDGPERVIENGEIRPLNSLLITPGVKIGYDLNMGLGMYFTPYIGANLQMNSTIRDDSWYRYSLFVGISLQRVFLER